MTRLREQDLRWHHNGTCVFAYHNEYTVRDTILSNPNAPYRYHVYAELEDDEVHLESYTTMHDVLYYLNNVAA